MLDRSNVKRPVRSPIRIVVIGTSGSGKTTTAQLAAERLGVPHIEMDSLHWGPNWTSVGRTLLRRRVFEALEADEWVLDGNYSSVRDIVWPRATDLVWLDYAFPIVAWRIVTRTIRRSIRQEELWSGNRESFRKMFSRDSILIWVLKTYWRRRRETPELLAQPQHRHLRVHHQRSPNETIRWLDRLEV